MEELVARGRAQMGTDPDHGLEERRWAAFEARVEAELALDACLVAGRELTAAEWDDALPARPYQAVCSAD